MKGHAKIEIKNVETGEKRVIEHDNMITNAVAELIKPLGIGYSVLNALYNKSKNIDHLFSGIMLFADPIEEDANIIVPPAGNTMVGKGDNTAYTGVDTTKGSFNIADSGYDENGNLKLVWEFNTSQANGTISCICLCPLEGGSIGVGSPVCGTDALANFYVAEKSTIQYSNETDVYSEMCIIDASTNKIMRTDKSLSTQFNSSDESVYPKDTQSLKCYIERIHLDNVTLKDNRKMRKIENIEIHYKDTVINALPSRSDSGGKSKIHCGVCNDGQYCYFSLSEKALIPANGKLYLTKFDISNNQEEIIEVTNTTGKNIKLRTLNDGVMNARLSLKVMKGYLFVRTEDDMIYRIKLSDNTDVSPATIGGTVYTDQSWFFNYDDGERLFLHNTVNAYVAVLDVVSNEVSYVNIVNDWTSSDDGFMLDKVRICGRPAYLVTSNYYSYYSRFYEHCNIICNPLLISTINNLTEPVTKTSSHTMKVTYTLSPSEE